MKKGKQTSRHLVSSTEPFLRRYHLQAFPIFRRSGPLKQAAPRPPQLNDGSATGLAEAARSSLALPCMSLRPFGRKRRSFVETGEKLRDRTSKTPRACSIFRRRENPGDLGERRPAVHDDPSFAIRTPSSLTHEMKTPDLRAHGRDVVTGFARIGRRSKVRPAWLTAIRRSGARPRARHCSACGRCG